MNIRSIILFSTLLINCFTNGFTLLEDVIPVFPKCVVPCEWADTVMVDVFRDAQYYMNTIGYQFHCDQPSSHPPIQENAVSFICNQKMNNEMGYMYPFYSDEIQHTNIWISDSLLSVPTTLYNVISHELLHSVGVGHSQSPGLMNYSVKLDAYGSVLEDSNRLWTSPDDLHALYTVSTLQTKKKEAQSPSHHQ